MLQARFLEGAGTLARWAGDDELAVARYEQSLAAAQAAGETALAAHVLGRLGVAAYIRGDVARARTLLAETLAKARAIDSGQMIGYAYVYLVLIAIGPHGSPARAGAVAEGAGGTGGAAAGSGGSPRPGRAPGRSCQAPRRGRSCGRRGSTPGGARVGTGLADPVIISFVPWLATVLMADHLPAEQLARVHGGIAVLVARSAAIGGRNLIDIFGAPTTARHWRERSPRHAPPWVRRPSSAEAAGRALSPPRSSTSCWPRWRMAGVIATWTRGAGLTRQPGGLLSPREREVLALLAEGRSNKAIAAALFVSPNTVKTHVASLLTKLGADNRAQLAIIAAQRGLLD